MLTIGIEHTANNCSRNWSHFSFFCHAACPRVSNVRHEYKLRLRQNILKVWDFYVSLFLKKVCSTPTKKTQQSH